eukprot:GILJ01011313.1.p1 GENE.GILJ01011313.1~~GILJ01011313.1.p1  ORF type:complete len:975 (+),score=144.53 GILJ01011313.1:413-3337(+)
MRIRITFFFVLTGFDRLKDVLVESFPSSPASLRLRLDRSVERPPFMTPFCLLLLTLCSLSRGVTIAAGISALLFRPLEPVLKSSSLSSSSSTASSSDSSSSAEPSSSSFLCVLVLVRGSLCLVVSTPPRVCLCLMTTTLDGSRASSSSSSSFVFPSRPASQSSVSSASVSASASASLITGTGSPNGDSVRPLKRTLEYVMCESPKKKQHISSSSSSFPATTTTSAALSAGVPSLLVPKGKQNSTDCGTMSGVSLTRALTFTKSPYESEVCPICHRTLLTKEIDSHVQDCLAKYTTTHQSEATNYIYPQQQLQQQQQLHLQQFQQSEFSERSFVNDIHPKSNPNQSECAMCPKCRHAVSADDIDRHIRENCKAAMGNTTTTSPRSFFGSSVNQFKSDRMSPLPPSRTTSNSSMQQFIDLTGSVQESGSSMNPRSLGEDRITCLHCKLQFPPVLIGKHLTGCNGRLDTANMFPSTQPLDGDDDDEPFLFDPTADSIRAFDPNNTDVLCNRCRQMVSLDNLPTHGESCFVVGGKSDQKSIQDSGIISKPVGVLTPRFGSHKAPASPPRPGSGVNQDNRIQFITCGMCLETVAADQLDAHESICELNTFGSQPMVYENGTYGTVKNRTQRLVTDKLTDENDGQPCPLCNHMFPSSEIQQHAANCLAGSQDSVDYLASAMTNPSIPQAFHAPSRETLSGESPLKTYSRASIRSRKLLRNDIQKPKSPVSSPDNSPRNRSSQALAAVECPLCNRSFPANQIEMHCSSCVGGSDSDVKQHPLSRFDMDIDLDHHRCEVCKENVKLEDLVQHKATRHPVHDNDSDLASNGSNVSGELTLDLNRKISDPIMDGEGDPSETMCPVCNLAMPLHGIQDHVERCLNRPQENNVGEEEGMNYALSKTATYQAKQQMANAGLRLASLSDNKPFDSKGKRKSVTSNPDNGSDEVERCPICDVVYPDSLIELHMEQNHSINKPQVELSSQ